MRAASAATTRSAVSTRCALTQSPSVSSAVSAPLPASMRSISSTIAAVRASSVAELSLRCRGHARSRYRPKVDGQRQHAQRIGRRRAVDDDVVPFPRSRPARRPREDRAPPEFQEVPKVLPGQYVPGRTRRIARSARPAISRHRASSSASVSSASASRNPPPASASSASTLVGSRSPVGTTGVPSTSPSECAWSVDTTRTRRPLCASRTAVAVASVDLPTPPLPTKRLIRAWVGAGVSVSLDSFLEVLQCGVGEPALGLALEQADHRDDKVDREFIGDIGARSLGRQAVCAVQRPEQ